MNMDAMSKDEALEAMRINRDELMANIEATMHELDAMRARLVQEEATLRRSIAGANHGATIRAALNIVAGELDYVGVSIVQAWKLSHVELVELVAPVLADPGRQPRSLDGRLLKTSRDTINTLEGIFDAATREAAEKFAHAAQTLDEWQGIVDTAEQYRGS